LLYKLLNNARESFYILLLFIYNKKCLYVDKFEFLIRVLCGVYSTYQYLC